MRKPSRIAAIIIVILILAPLAKFPPSLGTNSSLERTLVAVKSVASNAPNFTLTVYPLSQTVRIGEQATYQVTVNSTNAFAGKVSLQKENFPPELLGEFNPPEVSLKANSQANSNLTVNTISVGEQAFYEFTILASSGAITQTVTASLTVLAENAPPTIISYAFLAAVLLFTALIIWYGVRARRLQNQTREEIQDQPKPPPV
jgi:hypothetical protein